MQLQEGGILATEALSTVQTITDNNDVTRNVIPNYLPPHVSPFHKALHRTATWITTFKSPRMDYVNFMNRLRTQLVCLEQVTLCNKKCVICGSIVVQNICFEKVVFVRHSANNWRTFIDTPAQYAASSTCFHDTFIFGFTIPRDDFKHQRIEFAICFKGGGCEYWDNNYGKNYVFVSMQNATEHYVHVPDRNRGRTLTDAYKLDTNRWGQFAIWDYDTDYNGAYY